MKDEILIGKVKQSIGQVKTDCFAYAKGECKALNELYCKTEKCNFFKTKEEFCIEKIKENVAKEWLNRGRKLNSEINSLIKKQQRAFEQACNTTSPLQQDKVQSSKGNTAESNMIRYADYNDKINKKVNELHEVKKEILSAISKLDNKVYKTLLTERYIKFSRWEQVAKSINKTCTNTKARLHRSALKAVSKLHNN